MKEEQLLLFAYPITKEDFLMSELEVLNRKQNNLRKGIFARYDELVREFELLKQEFRLKESK